MPETTESEETLPSRAETSRAKGREERRAVPRRTHRSYVASEDRADPITLLRAQDADRLDDLVPVRWGRMSVSPFTFYRGSAALMAADLATTPRTSLTVQLCGDAHLSNFGLYASPERALMFDVNDFDETLPGPFEWDIKRLAASFVIAARNNAFSADVARSAAVTAARSYRHHMATYAEMGELDVWYSRVVADDLLNAVRMAAKAGAGMRSNAVERTQQGLEKVRGRTSAQAAGKLAVTVDGNHRFVDQPPLIMHFEELADTELIKSLFKEYTATLSIDRRHLLERFALADIARKVVGVGSVGTRCFIILMTGRDTNDPLILQTKEAGKSVLEQHLGASRYRHAGHRVVEGQRLMQAASDIFLGWMTGRPGGRHYYWRQLRDMKGSIEIERLRPAGLELYAEMCGWALARGHARSGDRLAISGYLGAGDVFDQAIADFAETYADQTEQDYEALLAAIKRGGVPVTTGV